MSNAQIAVRIESFVKELEALVRAAAIDAVAHALGTNGMTARPTAASRPSAPPTARAAPPSAPASAPKAVTAGKLAFKRRKGSKRSPEQLAAIDTAIVGFVKSHPGQGVEHMGKALGVPTDDLKLRVLGLVTRKKVKKTGVKRATKYYPV